MDVDPRSVVCIFICGGEDIAVLQWPICDDNEEKDTDGEDGSESDMSD